MLWLELFECRSVFTGQVAVSSASPLQGPLQAAEAATQLGCFGIVACMYQELRL